MDQARADKILNYWQGIEFLTPAAAPKADPRNRVWTISPQQPLPWFDRVKLRQLESTEGQTFRWEFVVYVGLIDMKRLATRLCELLGVVEQEREGERPPEPAAVLALQVDVNGVISGRPGLAGLPWAVSRLKQGEGSGRFDFTGFFGEGGFEQRTVDALKECLTDRQAVSSGTADKPGPSTCTEANEEPISAPAAAAAPSAGQDRRPCTWEDLQAALALALAASGCTDELVLHNYVRVQAVKVSLKREGEPESQAILNSYYVQDLELVRRAWSAENVGTGLRAYLDGSAEERRIDMVHDDDGRVVVDGTLPCWMPHGRWPARHPMVLAQQFAVNTLQRELPQGSAGLFSVNGPPGTGKTTMLRDVIAMLIVERAKVLVNLPSPRSAFSTRSTPTIGERRGEMYPVDERVQGFGLVVACLGNGAAQNVTRELPAAKAIDAPGVELDYFSDVAETLLAEDKARRRRPGTAWGMIAAVLGKAEFRKQFVNRFWFAESSKVEEDEDDDPNTRFVHFRAVLEAGVPGARPWEEQAETFKAALTRVEHALQARQQLAEALRHYGPLRQAEEAAAHVHRASEQALAARREEQARAFDARARARSALEAAMQAGKAARNFAQAAARCDEHAGAMPMGAGRAPTAGWDTASAQRRLADLSKALAIQARAVDEIDKRQPGAIARLLNTRGFKAWCEERAKAVDQRTTTELLIVQFAAWADEWTALEERRREAHAVLGAPMDTFSLQGYEDARLEAGRDLATQDSRCDEAGAALHAAEGQAAHDRKSFEAAQARFSAAKATIASSGFDGDTLARWNLADLPERARQAIAPWSDPTLDKLRHELFVEAIELHKSFIASNVGPLRANLGQLIDMLRGKLAPSGVRAGVRHLWESLFLCIPVVSTTFASMPSVFRGMGREDLGWLFIDEAGQAPPQAAAGSIWRAKRTLVVGDPLQLKPVVTVPVNVVAALEDQLQLPPTWNPRERSAQVLADHANRYGTKIGDEWLGSPLRVHRRCIDPMFQVANKMSYAGMMVYGTLVGDHEAARDWLGKSCWVDVPSRSGDGHWVPEQGRVALALLRQVLAQEHVGGQLFDEEGRAHVYVIAPFTDVADTFKDLLSERRLARSHDACGTIHTFQGKEADVVILLLGGDLARPGAISQFAAAEPNLLNVALTRAKRRIYVVGQHGQWARHQYFNRLAAVLPVVDPSALGVAARQPAPRSFSSLSKQRHSPAT